MNTEINVSLDADGENKMDGEAKKWESPEKDERRKISATHKFEKEGKLVRAHVEEKCCNDSKRNSGMKRKRQTKINMVDAVKSKDNKI